MNTLINAQRQAIAYYQNLLDNETNRIKRYLLKKEIKRSEKELDKIMKPKFKEL